MADMIKRNIPNMLTCSNLISGCIAMTFAIHGDARWALVWMIIGAAFDFFDGMVARLLHVSSPIGKELDSLADDVTFGVVPATIIFSELRVIDYPALLEPWRGLLPFAAFLIAAFSALRLAKFNLDQRQTMGFIGLPTPANALFWGSLMTGGATWFESGTWSLPVLLLMICFSSWLLIAEIPMFALKFKHWKWSGNEIRYVFLGICIPLLALFRLNAFAVIVPLYVGISLFAHLQTPKR